MKSNPIGPGTRNFTLNLPVDLYVEVERLAGLSGAKIGAYARAVLAYAVEHELIAEKNPREYTAWRAAVKAGIRPLPKVSLQIVEEASGKKTASSTGSTVALERFRQPAASPRVAEEPPPRSSKD